MIRTCLLVFLWFFYTVQFFAIILILFLLLVVGAVLAIVLRVQAEEEAKKSIQTYDSDSETADAWNTFQLTVSTVYSCTILIF